VIFKLEPEGKDPYGRLKGGQMILIGHLKSAKMCRNGDSELFMHLEAGNKSIGTFPLDYRDLAITSSSPSSSGSYGVFILIRPIPASQLQDGAV